MLESRELIVEVAYATGEEQALVCLKMPTGARVLDAIEASGLLKRFPIIDLTSHPVGIFGKACNLEQVLEQNDRVEIYRPLLHDPKDARRQRAGKR